MDEGKRKRNRKRPRRGHGESKISNGVCKDEGNATPSIDKNEQEPVAADTVANKMRAATPQVQSAQTSTAAAAAPGPSLSFYQKTNPHKPSALPSLTAGAPRKFTVSIAVPGSIVLNAQTPELQSRLAGHIARTCAIFNIDEVIVYDEGREDGQVGGSRLPPSHNNRKRHFGEGEDEGVEHALGDNEEGGQAKSRFDPNAFLARVLQYVETPQYLRKSLFPMHRDLRLAGLLPPLDCPHHLRFEDESPFREGVCVETPHWAKGQQHGASRCFVNIGLRDPIACTVKAGNVPIGARVTVRMPRTARPNDVGQLVSPRAPVEEKGLYWGYSVRLSTSLSDAIRSTPYIEPYDLVVGTSERGSSLTDLYLATAFCATQEKARVESLGFADVDPLPPFKHALVMFGGLSGLEVAVERDAAISLGADEASQLFDAWINVVEGQGSRTVRTEEALTIALSRLRPLFDALGQS